MVYYVDFLVIGHRANNWRVLNWYLRIGVPAIEIDVRTRDGELVVLHGPSPIKRASVFGRIIAWIDYRFFYRDPLIRKYKFIEILNKVNGRSDIVIDVKDQGSVEKILTILEKVEFNGRIYISSEIHRVVKYVKEMWGAKVYGIASLNILPVNPAKVLSDAKADIASIHINILSRDIVRELHDLGIKVITWTINDKKTLQKALDTGIDGVVTDRPDIILKEIAKKSL